MGGTLEELAELLELVRRTVSSAYICLDTAHAWAAGYDVATAEGMLRFLGRVHRRLDGASVRVFHLNDTRAKFGSFRENHEHWGKGFLGKEGLEILLGRSEYEEALGIIETPKGAAQDKKNLAFVSGLAQV